jgi:hypothetical protein
MIKTMLICSLIGCLATLCGCQTSTGLFPVCVDGKMGYIDKYGSLVIAPQYSQARTFSEGVALVEDDTGFFFIDCRGKEAVRLQTERHISYVESFSDGLAIGCSWWGKSFYDRTGRQSFDGEFEAADDFSCGFANVKIDGRWGYIDKSGSLVISNKFRLAGSFVDGAATVTDLNGRMGIIDKKGTYLVDPQYDYIADQSSGLFVAVTNRKSIYINRHGDQAIDAVLDGAGPFAEGKAFVVVHGKYGCIDRSGVLVVPARFDNVWSSFSEGLAAVEINGKWGYINHEGDMVIAPQFYAAYPFNKGLAKVETEETDAGFGYVNKNGKYVWEPSE